MVEIEELEARYDSRASFYNKALVETNDNGDITLYSYNTPICTISEYGDITNHFNDDISVTTSRHIKEFFKQYCDIDDMSGVNYNKFVINGNISNVETLKDTFREMKRVAKEKRNKKQYDMEK